jgi:hypothetical protein
MSRGRAVNPGDDRDCRTVFMFIMDSFDPARDDIACAAGVEHNAAATSATSEQAEQRRHNLLDHAVETIEAALDWLAGEHPFARVEMVS